MCPITSVETIKTIGERQSKKKKMRKKRNK